MAERDTHKYHLKQRHKVVHRGITYDPVRREAEHQADFPGSPVRRITPLSQTFPLSTICCGFSYLYCKKARNGIMGTQLSHCLEGILSYSRAIASSALPYHEKYSPGSILITIVSRPVFDTMQA